MHIASEELVEFGVVGGESTSQSFAGLSITSVMQN
jgi:hypothetical protein